MYLWESYSLESVVQCVCSSDLGNPLRILGSSLPRKGNLLDLSDWVIYKEPRFIWFVVTEARKPKNEMLAPSQPLYAIWWKLKGVCVQARAHTLSMSPIPSWRWISSRSILKPSQWRSGGSFKHSSHPCQLFLPALCNLFLAICWATIRLCLGKKYPSSLEDRIRERRSPFTSQGPPQGCLGYPVHAG